MPAATRLLAAFVMLIGAFIVLVGVAVASLFVVGQYALAAVVATAGGAGGAAGGLTYWFLRRDRIDEEEAWREPAPVVWVVEPKAAARRMPRVPRAPLRVQ